MTVKNYKNAKGQMRIIETIMAAFIIFAALSFMGIFAASPTSSAYEVTDLERMGYSALHDLDQQGLLASLVYEGRWSDLRTVLKITLPVDVYFNLRIYNQNWDKLNGDQIIYGESATFSDVKNIASVSYSLVGVSKIGAGGAIEAYYDPRILVLQITRG